MPDIQSSFLEANGLRFHLLSAGSGPLVMLCHGFPDLAQSWRQQINDLASAGFRVVAPDMRGYGQSSAPAEIAEYSIFHLVGDLIALVEALGETEAHLVGHDWGAGVAWNAALMRPDVFVTVTGMSVPFQPRRRGRKPIETFREISERKQLGEFYMVAYQEPGRAEQDYEVNVERTMRQLIGGLDGSSMDTSTFTPFLKPGHGLLAEGTHEQLPAWMDEGDMNSMVAQFTENGFRGPLNWYRNMDRNWELTSAFQGQKIHQPAMFITGDRDPVRMFSISHENNLIEAVPNLKSTVVLEGAGHWIHQEKAEAVSRHLIEFLS